MSKRRDPDWLRLAAAALEVRGQLRQAVAELEAGADPAKFRASLARCLDLLRVALKDRHSKPRGADHAPVWSEHVRPGGR